LRRIHVRLRRPINERKLHFFALFCCRLAWPALADDRSCRAVDVAERFLAGMADPTELAAAAEQAEEARVEANDAFEAGGHSVELLAYRQAAQVAAVSVAHGFHQSLVTKVRDALAFRGHIRGRADLESLLAGMADALRDIFGNPFRPVAFDPAWRTSDAVALARQMYESRDFGAMPVLADALQDAGCDCEEVLDHCRGGDTHVRGCWVVDRVLGMD
jgi:hypothetical protein